ncbi:MAG: hypothetical protein ABSC95_18070 [Acetobacteraceae bacterium]|jgi:hypothetical protein
MTEQLQAGGIRWSLRAAPTPESQARWRRCKDLSPVQRGESERLMAEFMATRSITVCPVRYAVPVEQRAQVVRGRH